MYNQTTYFENVDVLFSNANFDMLVVMVSFSEGTFPATI
jgi:hypothetical protein